MICPLFWLIQIVREQNVSNFLVNEVSEATEWQHFVLDKADSMFINVNTVYLSRQGAAGTRY